MNVKYSVPNKLSQSPYGEIVKVIGETKDDVVSYCYYIQTSIDVTKPLWLELGEFLVQVYEPKLNDKVWLSDKMAVYKGMMIEKGIIEPYKM